MKDDIDFREIMTLEAALGPYNAYLDSERSFEDIFDDNEENRILGSCLLSCAFSYLQNCPENCSYQDYIRSSIRKFEIVVEFTDGLEGVKSIRQVAEEMIQTLGSHDEISDQISSDLPSTDSIIHSS